ncbi:MAG TPA: TonB-dependent receptor, partial [Opitutaceae bacterium]
MNRKVVRRSMAFMSTLTMGVGLATAQTAPAASAPSADDDNKTITLDPFTVTTDQETYKAEDTLAGGRVRTMLRDTPSSLSVITAKLLQDLGVTDAEGLLIYTNNTEVAGLNGNFSGAVTRGQGIS